MFRLLSSADVEVLGLCVGFFVCLFVWSGFIFFVLFCCPVGMHAWAGEGLKGGTGKTAADLPASFEKSQINWLSVAVH